MTYLLIEKDVRPGEAHHHTIEVEVCSEDGTVHDSRFQCPTCSLRPDPRWGD